MNVVLIDIIISVIFVSLISFLGVITLFLRKNFLESNLFFLVSFAAGAMLGAAFLDLIPASAEKMPVNIVSAYILLGIIFFFLIEKVFHWYQIHYHHPEHHHKKQIKPVAILNLIGDGLHNFLDGVVITVAFLTDFSIGIVATLAVIFHEIPQEIGDFGVLVYGGFTKFKALMYNFLSALTSILGALLAYFFATTFQSVHNFLLPFAAGNFIYLASTDLLPELHHEKNFKNNLLHVLTFLIGIFIIWLVTQYFHG